MPEFLTPAMLIDTHCHLDASEFGDEAVQIRAQAQQGGVGQVVIPAVHRNTFAQAAEMAECLPGCSYALGIHPMYVPVSDESDIALLREQIAQRLPQDARLVAVGEIGLDYFVPALREAPLAEKQEWFYREQLKIARDFDLPVLLHVRRSQDQILKHLRRIPVRGGIAHAFNGSHHQAMEFIKLGFKLGFGGTMTFSGSRQIRRLAAELPPESIVLETDAPDIPPAWLHGQRNSPAELPQIAQVLAELRGWTPEETARITSQNALAAMPRLEALLR